jgi:dihydrofolate reductase
MRKIILSMQTSVDGYVEGENGDMSWIGKDGAELWADVFDILSNVDTAILGRGMFEGYRDYWKGCLTGDCPPDELKYAKWADKTKHILVSKTIKDPKWQNTTIISGSVVDEIKKIKSAAGGDIYVVGGGQLARTVIDAGLVDEYRITVSPYILKGGKSLYNPLTKGRALELISAKALDTGSVVLRYRQK